jgi:hypothetical protein
LHSTIGRRFKPHQDQKRAGGAGQPERLERGVGSAF